MDIQGIVSPNGRLLMDSLAGLQNRLTSEKDRIQKASAEKEILYTLTKLDATLWVEDELSFEAAWMLKPLLRSSQPKINQLACQILDTHHRDFFVTGEEGNKGVTSSVLLCEKSAIYPEEMHEEFREGQKRPQSIPISISSFEAVKKLWMGIPVSEILGVPCTKDSLKGLIEAVHYFGCEKLLNPDKLLAPIAEQARLSGIKLEPSKPRTVSLNLESVGNTLDPAIDILRLLALAGFQPKLVLTTDPSSTKHLDFILNGNHGIMVKSLELINATDQDCRAVARKLISSNQLRRIAFKSRGMSSTGAQALAIALASNKSLRSLKIHGGTLGKDGAEAFWMALKQNTKLRTLGLESVSLGDAEALGLASAIEENKGLRRLSVANNHIEELGMTALLQSVLARGKFKGLELLGNSLGKQGAHKLEWILKEPCSLDTISITEDKTLGRSAMYLCYALQRNTSLKKVSIGFKGLENFQASGFLIALSYHKRLRELALIGSPFFFQRGQDSPTVLQMSGLWMALKTCLLTVTSLKVLTLAQFPLKWAEDFDKPLLLLLGSHSSLHTLALVANGLTDEDAMYLARLAAYPPHHLKTIKLADNPIGPRGRKALSSLATNGVNVEIA